MNELQTSLFEAMKAFADNAKQNSNATLTIEASIIDIIDEGKGEYRVNYLGQKFSAFTNNPNLVYSVGDDVFVLVPDGNFDKKKTILGLSSPQATYSTVSDDEDNNITYYDLSDNLLDFTRLDDDHWYNGMLSLSSYEEIPVDYGDGEILYINAKHDEDEFSAFNNPTVFIDSLNNYLKYSRVLKLSFLVKTDLLLERQNSGRYGISIYGSKGDDTFTSIYSLNTDNMLGNPYRYTEWTPQTLYITVDDDFGIDKDTDSFCLSFFCYGFPLDNSHLPSKDIYIKNISLKSVAAIAQDENGYILTLNATEGLFFNEGYNPVKKITPTLKINGKTVDFMHGKDTKVFWFKQNSMINAQNERYLSYAGPGWECLNESTGVTNNPDGSVTLDWVTNNSTLIVNKQDIYDTMIYKCIIIYDGKQVSANIELTNTISNAFLVLNTTTGSKKYVRNAGKVEFVTDVYFTNDSYTKTSAYKNRFIYYWGRRDKKGKYIDDNSIVNVDDYNITSNGITAESLNECVSKNVRGIIQPLYESIFSIPVSLIDESNTFYCTALYVDDNNNLITIGTKEIIITTTDYEGYQLIVNNENTLYKYDVDGDSPMGEAYDGPSTSKITATRPLTFRVNKPDGTELTDSEYLALHYVWKIPKNSLFVVREYTDEDDDYKYVRGTDGHNVGLSYGIASRFSPAAADKKLTLTIDFNGTTIEKQVNIIFMKEGEGGTNGTAYAAVLVSGASIESECSPYSDDKKLIYKIYDGDVYFFNYSTNTWDFDSSSYYPIYPRVYRDSELLDPSAYNIEYSMFDSSEKSGTANPYFEIPEGEKGGNTSGKGIVIHSENPNYNSDVVPCTVLQAKITVYPGNAGTPRGNDKPLGSPFIIYAYYPIDIFFVYDYMNRDLLPKINNGFNQVMYEPDGTNPSYSSSQFTFDLCSLTSSKDAGTIDSILDNENTYYTLTANGDTIGGHLKLNGTPTVLESGSTIAMQVKPDMKYDDGNAHTYVSAVITQNNTNWNSKKLQQKQNELEDKLDKIGNQLSQLENSKEALQSFANEFNFNNYINALKELQTFLNEKETGIIKLKNILQYCDEILSYINIQKAFNNPNIEYVCYSTIDVINTLMIDAYQAQKQINHLDNSPGYTPSDLISLSSDEIPWDSTIEENYKNSLGLNCMITIRSAKDDINNNISAYQNIYDLLLNTSSETIDSFNGIINDITSACSYITDDKLPEYVDLKNKILKYLDEFKKHSSITELINILNQMYFNVLRGTFDLSGSSLKLSAATENYFEKTENNLKIQGNSISALYNYVYNCRRRWQNGLPIELARYVRSIPIYYSRIGLAELDAWDGNKVDIGDDYILTPWMGAGKKDEDTENKFTGILMGAVMKRSGRHIGLFGYSKEIQTLFLDAEKGSAIFGKAGNGQLYLDPDNGQLMIYSSNYWKNYTTDGYPNGYDKNNENGEGLCINFSEPYIRYGNGKFVVDKNGNAHIGGNGDSDVGGWDIHDTYLASANFQENVAGIKLDALNNAIIFGASDGVIYSGQHNSLNSINQPGFYLSNQGISIGTGFQVDENGILRLGNPTQGGYFEVNSRENELSSFDPWQSDFIHIGFLAYNSSSDPSYTNYQKFGAYLPSVRRYLTPQIEEESSGTYVDPGGHTQLLKWNYLRCMRDIVNTWQIGTDTLLGRISKLLYNKTLGEYVIVRDYPKPPIQFVPGGFNDHEVYVGIDGIRLGKYFAVNNEGSLQAVGSSFSHCVIDNTYIKYAYIENACLSGVENPIEIHDTKIKNAVIEQGDLYGTPEEPIEIAYAHLYGDNTPDVKNPEGHPIEIDYVKLKDAKVINDIDVDGNLIISAGHGLKYKYYDHTTRPPVEHIRYLISPPTLSSVISDYTKHYVDLGELNYDAEFRAVTGMWSIQAFCLGVKENDYPLNYPVSEKTGECRYLHFYISHSPNPEDPTGKNPWVAEAPIRDYLYDSHMQRHFYYDNTYFYDNSFHWATDEGLPNEQRRDSGPGTVHGHFIETSDIRQKITHSEFMSTELSKNIVCNLEPIAFEYKSSLGKYHRGFSAQQVEKVIKDNNLPQMIYQYEEDKDQYYIAYNELIPDLVNCIQDLYKQIKELKEKLNEHTN